MVKSWVLGVCVLGLFGCSTDDESPPSGDAGGAGSGGTGAGTAGVGGLGASGSTTGGTSGANVGGSGALAGGGAGAGGLPGVGGGVAGRQPECTDGAAGRGVAVSDTSSPTGWLYSVAAGPNGTCDSNWNPFEPSCVGAYPCFVDQTFPYCVPEPSYAYCIVTSPDNSDFLSWVVTCTDGTPSFEYCANGCAAITGEPYYCLQQ